MIRLHEKLLTIAIVCLAPLATMAQLTPGKPAQTTQAPQPARLRGFTPTQSAQGTSVILTFTGINFAAPASVIFSPNTGLTAAAVTVSNSNQIQVTLKIDASAPLGPRQVLLIVADHSLTATMPFTVTAGQPCTANLAAVGCQPSSRGPAVAPALQSYSPTQGAQGASITLTFAGSNFAAPASIAFNPPTGLMVQSVQVSSASQLQVRLQIAATAPLGQRNLSLIVADHSLGVKPPFTVTPGGQPCTGLTANGAPCPPVHLPMTILRVTPNQIPAGSQNVELKIEGTNFSAGAMAAFATESGALANVFPQGPARYVNSTEIHVTVNVLPAAVPGGRDITITNPNAANVLGKGLLNILPAAAAKGGPPPKVKLVPIAFQHFPEGKINLQEPKWGTVYDGADSAPENYGIPPLNDETVLEWAEQNPGMADYFEVRIYARDGKTLVGTKRIDGSTVMVNGNAVKNVPTYYHVDPAFLNQVLSKAAFSGLASLTFLQPTQTTSGRAQGAKTVRLGASAGLALQGTAQQSSAQGSKPIQVQPASAGPQIPDGDLQWEVAGFRTYNKDGSARGTQNAGSQIVRAAANLQAANSQPDAGTSAGTSGGQTDVEVEISDRWALSATAFPTGLSTCSLAAPCGKGLQFLDLDAAKAFDQAYVGDSFILTGNFDLSRSPYATHPKQVQAPPQTCGGGQYGCFQNTNPVQEFQFDNLFVDWGDGTVEKLNAVPADPNASQWNSNTALNLPNCDPRKKANPPCYGMMPHTYNYPNQYTIRVFQLSDQDVQQVQASLVAASADGPAVNPYLAAATLQKISFKGIGSSPQAGASANQSAVNALASGGPSPSDVAGRAYMIFCHTLVINTVQDPLANGPLYLRGIEPPDFPNHDISGQGLLRAKTGVVSPSELQQSGGGQGKAEVPVLQEQAPQNAGQGKTLKPRTPLQPGGATPAPIAICSACDDSLLAQTKISYVGYGQVRVTWHVDGGTWPPQSNGEPVALGPSNPRTNLTRQEAAQVAHPDPDKVPPTTSGPISSKRLPLGVTPAADHGVWVEAEVMPSPPPPNLSTTLSGSLHSIVDASLGGGGGASANDKAAAASQAAQAAQTALRVLTPPASSGLPPLKVGFLSPSNHASNGLGPVQYVNSSLSQIAAAGGLAKSQPHQPGSYVSSNSSTYEVTNADPKQPCKFLFPVKDGGTFEVTGLQNHATESGGKWNGTGTLLINLASSNGYEQYPGVAIKIQNWQVDSSGMVHDGATFDTSSGLGLALAQDTPAMKGTIDRLRGTAGDKTGAVMATLSVQLADNSVRLPDNSPVKWSGVESTLSSTGDWYAKGLTLPQSLLGWTSFTIQSNDVRLDLSQNDGDAPGSPCAGASGTQWVGVRVANATITPFTFNLAGTGVGAKTEPNWAVDKNNAVCGTFDSGVFTATVEQGSVSFKSIHMQAAQQTYEADYKGVDVHVPWLNVDLTGDAQLLSGGGKVTNMTLPLSGTAQPLKYANVAMKASNLQFTMLQGVDLAAQANTEWDLSAENKPFAQIKTNMYFGMDGRAYFKQGSSTQDVTLGGSSSLGSTPLELVSAHLTAPTTGTDVLSFAVQTKLHLSEVMPASDVQVNYSINQPQQNQYSATGPTNAPFTVVVPYPAGQPASEGKIHPTYNGGSSGGGGNGGDAYSGSVDLSQLGGPPVTGEFRLGYRGGHDYWLTRVTIGLGQEGVPIIPAPPVMNLYAIRGGLGHNFPISAFADAGWIMGEQPSMDNSFLFMAGMRVGMPDQFTYMLDGNLTIEASGQNAGARMDFHAWLLTTDQSGNGQFQGYFQYAGNNFDGRVWGGLNFMNGLASFDLGNSANNAAIDLHFGGGSWHIDAGKKEGPRIQAHFIIANANAYVMLGSDVGLAIGGDANFCLCIGDDSVASAYIKGDLDIGVQITPQPHFIGDASANLDAGVCAFSVCVSGGVSAQVHLEALPLDMNATASLTLPIPFWNPTISFSAHL